MRQTIVGGGPRVRVRATVGDRLWLCLWTLLASFALILPAALVMNLTPILSILLTFWLPGLAPVLAWLALRGRTPALGRLSPVYLGFGAIAGGLLAAVLGSLAPHVRTGWLWWTLPVLGTLIASFFEAP